MKKYLNKFWIAPAFTVPIFIISYCIYYLFFLDNPGEYTKDFGLIDCGGYLLYAVLLFLFGLYRKDFLLDHKKTFWAFIFLILMAVLREAGAQKWLPSQDTTMWKIRFFTNPDNPLFEKFISAAVFIILVGVVIYLLTLYLKPLIKGFFKKDPLSWTIATLFVDGASSKIVDRLPSNLGGFGLEVVDYLRNLMLIFEETGELLLPALVIMALLQFHFIYTPRNKQVCQKKTCPT